MATLARSIGLGLAARGDIDDVIRWARQARDGGLDSIWIHDSYYERDAITFAVVRSPLPSRYVRRCSWLIVVRLSRRQRWQRISGGELGTRPRRLLLPHHA